MNNLLKLLWCLLLVTQLGCQSNQKKAHTEGYLYSVIDTTGSLDEYGYRDSAGNMIVPFGKYSFHFSDTIKTIGFVAGSDGAWVIDKQGEELFQFYPSPNNGPDEVNEGLFRILGADGTIGFADMEGRIIISPRFSYVGIFLDGKAKFCQGCPVGSYEISQTETFRHALMKVRNEMPDMFFITSGHKYGWINQKGDTIIRPENKMLFPEKDVNKMVYNDGRFFYIDSIGNEVDYDPLKHPNQHPISKDIHKRIIYLKNEEELLKLAESL